MENPVILGTTGHTYDRSKIIEALRRRPNKDPISNSTIYNSTLTPNYSLINIMKQIKKENLDLPGGLNTNNGNANRRRPYQERYRQEYA